MSYSFFPGDRSICIRCNRLIILVEPNPHGDPTLIPRWMPAELFDRKDCPDLSGEYCTPYQKI